jgi:uncharacterized protein
MRKSLMILLLSATASLTATVAMAADPTPDQIYAAAESGRLDQARAMVSQVLKDHPNSAKAHYVASEVDAKSGMLPEARQELQTAEKIDPAMSFAKAGSVAELRAELFPSQTASVPATRTVIVPAAPAPVSHFHFPWGTVLFFGLMIWLIWRLVFRRYIVAPMGGPVYGGPRGPMDGGYGYGGPGYGGYPPGGGIGSGIAGGLASGLAVGAGVVAGEELAHHFLDGGQGGSVERVIEPEYRDDPGAGQNADMGGNDFGLNDSSSWDDSSGGGGDFGGGGDNSW